MRDINEVLRKKLRAVRRLRKEVDALRLVASLLADDGEPRCSSQPLALATARTTTVQGLYHASRPFPVIDADSAKIGAVASRISSRLRRLAMPLLSSARIGT